MKIKAQTLQQRFGFQDDDLKSANHDEIMIWLDENIEVIMNGFLVTDKSGDQDDLGDFASQVTVIKKQWEMPIMNGNFMIGFIDMLVRASVPFLCEYPKQIGPFPDYESIPCHTRWSCELKDFMFEVKCSIPSLGELLRQLAMYRQYNRDSDVIVVCPDNKFEKALSSQGVGFIHYPFTSSKDITP